MPGPTSSPSPGTTIAAARALPVGSIVTVRGTVTAEAGRLGSPPLAAIQDATGGIVLKLPDGVARPARGDVLVIRGAIADPYGQVEMRPAVDGVTPDGTSAVPDPLDLAGTGPGESTEGRLVAVTGRVVVKPAKSTSGDIAATVEHADGTLTRVMADASSGIELTHLSLGATYRLVGIAGQRATSKGALDGYRVWLRDPSDIALVQAPPSPSPSSTPGGPTPKPGATAKPSSSPSATATVSIAVALRSTDRAVGIEAVVTAGPSLLDASGRRIVVQDDSGAIEVFAPKDTPVPGLGTRVRVEGRVGTAYGAPRLKATVVRAIGYGAQPAPLRVTGRLTAAHTWRLVTVAGRIDRVRKLGERWSAEVLAGATRQVVIGQPGARIPIATMIEGRSVEVTGIVRPAYPSASDRRSAVLPRSIADVRVGAGSAMSGSGAPAALGAPGAGTAAHNGGTATTLGGGTGTAASATPGTGPTTPLADLAELDRWVGRTVRVGGIVVDVRGDGFDLDDGTAIASIVLRGDAVQLRGLVEPGDAVNVEGAVEDVDGGHVIAVTDPATVVLGSDPFAAGAGAVTADPDAPTQAPSPDPATAGLHEAGLATDLESMPGAGASLLGLLAVSLASVGVTAVRRRRASRLLAARVAARLASIAGQPPAPMP